MSEPCGACTLTHPLCHIGPAAHFVALTAEARGWDIVGPHTSPLAQALWLTLTPKCNFAEWLLLRCSVDGC